MTWSRRMELTPADALRAGVPLLLLLLAVAFPYTDPVIVAVLVAGVAISISRRAPVAWSWAAVLPAATIAAMRDFGPRVSESNAGWCSVASAPPVVWSVGEAAVVVATIAILGVALKAKAADIGVRRPAPYAIRWAVMGGGAILAAGLAAVLFLLQPMAGGAAVTVDGVGFLLPGAVFAIALAISEETAWRGALQGWLSRLLGPFLAALAQAILYGISWGVALESTFAAVIAGAAGMLLAAVVIRTRSLLVVVAWHAAFNVASYLVLACRPG